MRPRLVIAVAACSLVAASLVAQEVTGSIRGRILEAGNKPAAGVRVTVSGQDLLANRTVSTDADGFFHILVLPPGEYTVHATRIGSRPIIYDRVIVALGTVTVLSPVSLEPQAVQLDAMRISGQEILIDPMHTDAGATLSAADYVSLPGERDYKGMIAILPHVNDSHRGDPPNSAGSTGLENMYFIDGVNVTSPFKAETGTSLPFNFIRAVEVKTGGYEAQYGKALGAIVNAVTYSGTNDFEINVFGFGTHSSLSATPNAEPTLHEKDALSYDAGVRVSGPLKHDRIWYSAAYNPRVDQINREIENYAAFPDKKVSQIFAGKITWRPEAETNVELSMFGDPTTHDAVTVPFGVPSGYRPLSSAPYRSTFSTGGVVSSLRVISLIAERLSLEASAARAVGNDNSEATDINARLEPMVIDDVMHTVGGGGALRSVANLRRSAAMVRGTLNVLRHTTVIGAEYEDAAVSRELSHPGGFTIRRRDTTRYVTVLEDAHGPLHSRVPTAYLNDSWRVTDAVTLSIGLRWSTQTLLGASGHRAQRFENEWQPRLGIIWMPDGTGRRRLFGSFGRYYQQVPLNLSTLWYLDFTFLQSIYGTDPRESGATPTSVFDGTTKEIDWAKNIRGLAAENSDEFTVGYEQLLGRGSKLTARIVRRSLRSSFQWGIDPSTQAFWVVGTPGKGTFNFLPSPIRQYTALEFSAAGEWRGIAYRGSYVISRNRGNYSGLYASDIDVSNPGFNNTFFAPHQALNSTGPLPNDHTHVIKLSAFRNVLSRFQVGGFLTSESGSPLNEFATGPPDAFPVNYAFVVPRGSAGRTPWLWDLSLRLAYEIQRSQTSRARAVLDILHVGNPQRAVQLDELRYLSNSGIAFSNENPQYKRPTAFQPPMMARVGLELGF